MRAITQAYFSGGSSKALAIHREHRIYVSDRDNDRIQVSSEDGQFIEEWPDIEGPTGIYIDQNEQVRVMSTTLNQISQYRMEGVLQYQFGSCCPTYGGFNGGFSQPHQMNLDNSEGNLYGGGYVTSTRSSRTWTRRSSVGQPMPIQSSAD